MLIVKNVVSDLGRLGRLAGVAATVGAMIVSVASRTEAQPAEEPPKSNVQPAEPTIVPPTPKGPVEVSYPQGAQGNATVVLAVTVNADGTVRSTRVIEGDEPFASAASAAAERWLFSPATRNGQAVAATIRFQVSFVAPAPTEAPAASASAPPTTQNAPAAASATPPPPTEEPSEVVVRGKRIEPGGTSLTRAEVRQLPGAFGDPFRAIDALPGVTPIVSGLPYFYVRGAPPGNVGYFVDGVRVPYLFHLGVLFSVVHPAMMDRVDLYRGGYPARFGRYAGGIVSGETTAPRPDLHGEANVRLFDAGAMAETGFANGRGTVLLGGRYSYTAAIISLLAPNVVLDYRDFQARTSYDFTPDDRVTAFAFGAYDLLGEKKEGVLDILFGTEFYRLDLRYDHAFGNGSNIRYAVTFGFDQTRIAQARNAIDRIVAPRIELHHPLSKDVLLRSGVDGTMDNYGTGQIIYRDPDDPDAAVLARLFPERTDLAIGGWLDFVWQATPEVEVVPGLRVDWYESNGATAVGVDPRLAATFKVTNHFRIIHAYGLTHQPPSFVIPLPGLSPSDLRGGLQTSFQSSAGVETDLPASVTASATVFYNAFFNMTDAFGSSGGDFESSALEQRSMGSGVGLELLVKRPLTEKLGGQLAYTLSRSIRSVGREEFPSTFDRTHVLSAAAGYDLGKNWRPGARLLFYTGVPVRSPSNGLIVAPRPSHPDRSPAFYRIDVRLEKRWIIAQDAWISLVFECMNATLSEETFSSSTGHDEKIGPITLPSIGVEGGF